MKDSLKVILAALAATLIFPLTLFAEKNAPNLIIPKNWVYSTETSKTAGINTFFTSSDPKKALTVLIRTISVPHQSALQWANDEAENLKSEGSKILAPPVEIAVNKSPWVKLETQRYFKSAYGGIDTMRIEQYFAKQGSDLVVEVCVGGIEMNFNASNRQSIEELLSSFNSEVKTAPSLNARDLTLSYQIVSPKYVEIIKYTTLEIPFNITAPKNWYMAMLKGTATKEDPGKVVFCKDDPTESMKKGFFKEPYIRIDIARALDFESTSIIDYSKQLIPKLKNQGLTILTEVEELKVDGVSGSHFTTGTIEKNEKIFDHYYFLKNDFIIMVTAVCYNQREFEETKGKIKEAVTSIKFKEQ